MFNYQHDILPIGSFETIPVVSKFDPIPDNYPEVVKLNIFTDVDKLRSEWHNYPKTGNYFRERMKYFKNSIKETISLFNDLGFNQDNYNAYPLRNTGTNILNDNVGQYTRFLLESFGVDLFRQQYVVAEPGWETKLHIDHPDFSIHGFRVFIPIDTAYIGFDDRIYELQPGNCYFVNIARLHKGITKQKRVVIMCQMSSDSLILKGEKMQGELYKEFYKSNV
jgi:hypothetical protein